MNHIKCSECRHWKPVDYGPKGHGECKHPMVQDSDSLSEYAVPRTEVRNDGIVVGGDPYYTLLTGPRFGCIHGTTDNKTHAPIENTPGPWDVAWVAWKADGRGYLFRASEVLTMGQACARAEKLFGETFVTVEQLESNAR